jgi:hypothetical protein
VWLSIRELIPIQGLMPKAENRSQRPRSKVSFTFRADCAENGGVRKGLSNIQLDNPLLAP